MYGPVVRFGPNIVSVSDPRAIPTIYPSRPGFPKSDFYHAQKPYTRNKGTMPAVFNTQDEELHKQLRSPIASLYSMTNVVKLEPLVDQTLAVLWKQLDQRFLSANDKPFYLGNWLQYFAFDSMGTLTFSRRYGFLEQGRDMHGILDEIGSFMTRVAVMGQNPRSTGFDVLKVVDNFISQRLSGREKDDETDEKDMLCQFLDESSLGVHSTDIEAIIWSHAHFDHIGDPSTSPLSTELVVGPGIRGTHWPGFPTNSDAINLITDIQGCNVREISFEKTEKGATKIGSSDALDYFSDGSLYLLDAAGHSVSHIGTLARVTTSPDSAALKTVDNIKELGASDNAFVVLVHDGTLKGNVDFYPLAINDWKAKGYGKKTKWLF
ncbi:cytochrome P450 [Aspergillus leporis]|uniref:Cytochrome P450 n=1 Tax=Aspergillus leporis TaxID=41062 RepID=A0A5N5X158_9EURO|nr:cytochrome P450 [Aspergillus leporis]